MPGPNSRIFPPSGGRLAARKLRTMYFNFCLECSHSFSNSPSEPPQERRIALLLSLGCQNISSFLSMNNSAASSDRRKKTVSLPPQDEVAGSPTGFGARWWRDVGLLDLFPVLRIERLAIAEHSLSRKVIEIHE